MWDLKDEIDQESLLLMTVSVWGVTIIIMKFVITSVIRHPLFYNYVISKFKLIKKRTPIMINRAYAEIIDNECLKEGIDPDLFCAIVNAESNWDPKAIRYEMKFDYISDPAHYAQLNNITIDTEMALQKFSYGLCQLMGANFRSLGFDGCLTEMLDPAKNIEYGVRFFKNRCDIYKEIKDKISAYNGGKPLRKDGVAGSAYINQAYVDKVYSYYLALKKPKK